MVCLPLTWKRLIVALSSLGDFGSTSGGDVLVREIFDDRIGDIRVSSQSRVIMRWGLLCFRLRMFSCGERSLFLNDWGKERMTTGEIRMAVGEFRMATGEVLSGMAALMGEGAVADLVPGCVSLQGILFSS
jgi:hypothetical protein